MKLRELLKKIDLKLRPLEGDDRPVDNVDGVASAQSLFSSPGPAGPGAPPNWVPSQQDERPRH
jgi:hypothetical protein